MLVHSPHIGPGPDVRRNTVFVTWDTPPSPKPGLVPHRKICPAGEPFSHGGFFSAVENPPLGEKISWKRKSSIKNEKQTQGREEQRSSLPWVICNDWMNASSIFFLLILLFENGAKGYAKGYPQAQPDPYSGSALNTLVKAMLQRITMTIPMRILMAIFFRGLSFPTQICNDLRKQSTVFVKGPAVKKPMCHCGRWGPPCRRRTRRRWRGPPSRS